MRKRKYTTPLVMAVIAVGFLIVGTNVMAVENCGPDFTQAKQVIVSKNGDITLADSPYYVKFLGVFPTVCADGLCPASDGTYYRWVYQIQDSNGTWENLGVPNIQFFVPAMNDQCDLNNEYFVAGSEGKPTDPTGHIFNPGDYETNPFWRFVFERQIIKNTRDDSSTPAGIPGEVYSFYTKFPSKAKVMSLYIKAAGNAEYIATTLGPSQPEETPKIETSCEQIKKNSDPPQCVFACYETENGVMTKIVSADLYLNADCSGTRERALKIFEPDDPNKMLMCTPCNFEGSDVGAPSCTTNTTDQTTFPFRFSSGTAPETYKNCDVFKKEYQSLGVTLEIGEDPCRVLSGRLVCW